MSSIETAETIQSSVNNLKSQGMSYEAWLNWEHEGGLSEWVDGKVIFHMGVLLEHQRIADFLNRLLGFIVELLQHGVVLSAPMSMRVLSNGNAREPDIFFIERQHTNRLTSRQLEGPADLAIEIISEESVNRDRVDKFYEYQKGGVREYWIIDPREGRQRVDLYVLDETGRYQPVPPEVGGIYRSVVIPGFWLREAWLWQENPNVLAALTEVVGVERMIEAVRQSS